MTSQAYETLMIEKRGDVDWLTLNRPEALNAINLQMVHDLTDYFGRLYNDAQVRVVVMRGAGRAFCAGLDIKEFAGGRPDDIPFGGGFGFQGYLADVYVKMRRCPQPIIAAVQGDASCAGFAFTLSSDFRISAVTARITAALSELRLAP